MDWGADMMARRESCGYGIGGTQTGCNPIPALCLCDCQKYSRRSGLLPTRADLAVRDRKRWRMPKGGACAAGWDQEVAHLHESDRTGSIAYRANHRITRAGIA